MTKKLVFLLEELSAKEMLDGLLPRLLPEGFYYQCIVFEGKSSLEKRMSRRIRAWQEPGVCFVVLRDQNSGDCLAIKERLQRLCHDAGREDAVVRIVCRELESWYLADMEAVEKGLGMPGISRYQRKKKYRTTDDMAYPSRELERLTKGKYQKVIGSRSIGPYLSLENSRSNSFRVFIEGIQKAIA